MHEEKKAVKMVIESPVKIGDYVITRHTDPVLKLQGKKQLLQVDGVRVTVLKPKSISEILCGSNWIPFEDAVLIRDPAKYKVYKDLIIQRQKLDQQIVDMENGFVTGSF